MNVVVLGSTGSVGTQTLDVISAAENFTVSALGGGRNTELLKKQIDKFHPRYVTVADEESAQKLRMVVQNCQILHGTDAEAQIASMPEVDCVVIASSSLRPLKAFYAAAKHGKKIAISNKEIIVAYGDKLLEVAEQNGATVVPVDSEHNAIFQCLVGEKKASVDKLLLTASGGAFRDLTKSELAIATADKALLHPNWKMGAKITIDCATLANKGLELIEAMRLFKVSADDVEIVLHRESIIHSMVRFSDGSVKALMSTPDMRLPISYALHYPDRAPKTIIPELDFSTLTSLNFGVPDEHRFPCLATAKKVARKGGLMPFVFTSANDAAVQAYLSNKIAFYGINYYIEEALGRFADIKISDPDELYEWDAEIKRYVTGRIDHYDNI